MRFKFRSSCSGVSEVVIYIRYISVIDQVESVKANPDNTVKEVILCFQVHGLAIVQEASLNDLTIR